MSRTLILVLLIPDLLGLALGLSYMAEEDGSTVCEVCECDFGRVPYFVDCSGKKIRSMLTNWDIQYPEGVKDSEIIIDVG